jgi:hypothetical protein
MRHKQFTCGYSVLHLDISSRLEMAARKLLGQCWHLTKARHWSLILTICIINRPYLCTALHNAWHNVQYHENRRDLRDARLPQYTAPRSPLYRCS